MEIDGLNKNTDVHWASYHCWLLEAKPLVTEWFLEQKIWTSIVQNYSVHSLFFVLVRLINFDDKDIKTAQQANRRLVPIKDMIIEINNCFIDITTCR